MTVAQHFSAGTASQGIIVRKRTADDADISVFSAVHFTDYEAGTFSQRRTGVPTRAARVGWQSLGYSQSSAIADCGSSYVRLQIDRDDALDEVLCADPSFSECLAKGTRETSETVRLNAGAYIHEKRRQRGWRQTRNIPGLAKS